MSGKITSTGARGPNSADPSMPPIDLFKVSTVFPPVLLIFHYVGLFLDLVIDEKFLPFIQIYSRKRLHIHTNCIFSQHRGFFFCVFVWFGVLFLFLVVFFLLWGGGCYGDIKVILYNVASNMNALVSNGISYL